MRGLTRRYKIALPIRVLAQNLTAHLPSKKFTAEAKEIHRFVRDDIRFVKDIEGVETLQTPVQTLQLGSGDCDDKAILISSLLASIGHPTRFIACGFFPGMFSHVFTQTKIADQWISLECTEPWPMGRHAPNIKSIMVMRN